MAKKKTKFTCQECGYQSPKYMGKCPGCGQWNTLVEEMERDEFHTEKYYDSYNIFGAHIVTEDEMRGVRFTVWAPHAKAMSVVGDFNEWDYEQHKMLQVTEEGIWSLFIPHIEEREIYK
ncbi:hypothetical protein ACT453_07325, partial [Bacillus sp. D-CC]